MANETTGIKIQIVTTVNSRGADEAKKKVTDLGKAATTAGKEGAKGLNELQKPLGNLKQAFGQLTGSLGVGGGFGSQIFGVLKGAFKDVKQEAAGVTSAWDLSTGKIAAFGAIGAAAALGLVLIAKKAADAFASWSSEVKTVQARVGGTAEDASRLTVVMEHLGISAEEGAKAFQILGRNIINAPSGFRDYFTAVQLADLRNKDLIQSLPLLQQKFQSLGNEQAKSAFIMTAFGRGGQALRPLLSLTADETKRLEKESDRLGLTLTQAGIVAGTNYKRSLNDLTLAFRGLGVQLGQSAIPAISQLVNGLTGMIEKYNQADKWLKKQVDDGTALGTVLKVLLGANKMTAGALDQHKTSALGAAEADAELANSSQAAADSLQSATLSVVNANRSYDRAVRSVSDAQQGVVDAQRNLTTVRRDGAKEAERVQQAERGITQAARGVEQAERGVYDADRSLIEAHRGVEQAERALMSAQEQRDDTVRSLADAQEKLTEAQKRFEDIKQGPDAITQAEAQLRTAQATTSVQRAQQRLSQAEVNAEKVRRDYNATADDKADAELSVTEASQGLQAAQIDEQRSQEALTKTMADGTEGSDSYKEALDGVQQASQAVEQAQRQQRDASQAVSDAQLALIATSGQVEQAEYAHQQAVIAVSDAQYGTVEASRALRDAQQSEADHAYAVEAAQRAVQRAQLAVNDANTDAALAALAAQDAQQKQADALLDAGANAQILFDRLNKIKTQFPQYAGFFDQILKLLGTAVGEVFSIKEIGGGDFGGGGGGSNARGTSAVPRFAEGGTVPGPTGAPMLAVVHGGENIYKPGTSGNTYYVTNVYNAGSVIAERDLAETVRKVQIDQARRGG